MLGTLRPWMCLVVGFFETIRCEMRVDLGGNEVRMAQELLDAAQISPSI